MAFNDATLQYHYSASGQKEQLLWKLTYDKACPRIALGSC